MEKECAICYNPETKRRVLVTCPNNKCEELVCVVCFKKQILMKKEKASCMFCELTFTSNFLVEIVGPGWFNKEYRIAISESFINSQKALLPSTQKEASAVLESREIGKEIIALENQAREIILEIQKLKTKQKRLVEDGENDQESQTIMVNCFEQECRGYMDKKFICGTCKTRVCKKCHVSIPNKDDKTSPKHVCKKSDVETISSIKKDTQICPGCGIRIHKIKGCDQMFCVSCKTAFSYKTGLKTKGQIHNPHYFEMMSNDANFQLRNPNDLICGGILSIRIPRNLYITINGVNYGNKIQDRLRYIAYIQERKTRIDNDIHKANNDDLKKNRIRYINKEIDEKKFENTVKLIEKKIERYIEISQVFDLFLSCCIDITRDFTSSDSKISTFEEWNACMDRFYNYATESLKKIGGNYKCKPVSLDDKHHKW